MKLGATANLESTNNVPVELFSRSGLVGSAILSVNSQGSVAEGCAFWPVGQLSTVPASVWRTGLRKGVAVGLKLDSLEGLNAADSSLWTTELARIASAATDGSDPAFRGLPFAVRKAYRFVVPRKTILIGDVVRKINEEANPREEHLLLVAERDSSADKYVIAFQSRVAGSEDIVRTNEILAVVKFVRTGLPAIILTFEYEDGGRIALLERTGERQWKITWRSAYAGC